LEDKIFDKLIRSDIKTKDIYICTDTGDLKIDSMSVFILPIINQVPEENISNDSDLFDNSTIIHGRSVLISNKEA